MSFFSSPSAISRLSSAAVGTRALVDFLPIDSCNRLQFLRLYSFLVGLLGIPQESPPVCGLDALRGF